MKIIALLSLSLVLVACSSQKNDYDSKTRSQYTGLIEKQGITSYQYGTHTLNTEAALYALKSETVDLDSYVGKTISLTAELVDGYPVDGGPIYLNVIKIKK